jgi:hypothetical protein
LATLPEGESLEVDFNIAAVEAASPPLEEEKPRSIMLAPPATMNGEKRRN